MRWNVANNAQSILSASMTASDTSLTVADASPFPAPPFLVTIEDEIIEVGAVAGNVFSSLTRGMEGTTPADHAAGEAVENRFTAGTLIEIIAELLPKDGSGLMSGDIGFVVADSILNAVLSAANRGASRLAIYPHHSGSATWNDIYIGSAFELVKTGSSSAPTFKHAGSSSVAPFIVRIGHRGIFLLTAPAGTVGNAFVPTEYLIWHAGNDGAGSGLDADLLDGQHGSHYLPASSYTAADVKAKLLTVDGAGSGVDADLLDGLNADSSANASTIAARDSAGDLHCRILRPTYATTNATAGSYFVTQRAVGAGVDNYQRPSTPAQARSILEVQKTTVSSSAPASPAVNDLWIQI